MLNQLNQAEEARRAKARTSLDSAVAALNGGGGSSADEDSQTRGERARGSGSAPFAPGARRTTHGGPPGGPYRQRLIEAARSRRGW